MIDLDLAFKGYSRLELDILLAHASDKFYSNGPILGAALRLVHLERLCLEVRSWLVMLQDLLGCRAIGKDIEQIRLGSEVVPRELATTSVQEVSERLLTDVQLLLIVLELLRRLGWLQAFSMFLISQHFLSSARTLVSMPLNRFASSGSSFFTFPEPMNKRL